MAEPARDSGQLCLDLLRADELAGHWVGVALSPGETLFNAGDPGDALYVVTTGELDAISPDGLLLERLGPGACIGEIAILDGGLRSAAVVARGEAELERLSRRDLLSALARSPGLIKTLLEALHSRMRRMTQYLNGLTAWARQMGSGDYAAAGTQLDQLGADAADANLRRFVDTFASMMSAVQAREETLRREVMRLRIEVDGAEQAKHVAEITEDDYFRDLQRQADDLRRRMKGP